jgi:hypothetical protein
MRSKIIIPKTFLNATSLAKQSFRAIAFLRRFCQTCLVLRELDHPIFTALDFTTVFFFYRARSSALHPTSNLENQVPAFMSPGDRVAHFFPPGTHKTLSIKLSDQGTIHPQRGFRQTIREIISYSSSRQSISSSI